MKIRGSVVSLSFTFPHPPEFFFLLLSFFFVHCVFVLLARNGGVTRALAMHLCGALVALFFYENSCNDKGVRVESSPSRQSQAPGIAVAANTPLQFQASCPFRKP